MERFGVIEGERRRSVEETVEWHLRRLKGVDIWDEVLFTEDGTIKRGTVLGHESDIRDSENGTVSIGGNCRIRRVPIESIIRVVVRRAERISGMPPVAGGETSDDKMDFYANAFGIREGIGAALGGRQEASGERVPTDGHGKIVGGAGGRKRRGVNGQISGRDGNVVHVRFGRRNVK